MVSITPDHENEVSKALGATETAVEEETITITVNVPERLKLGDFRKFDRMFSNKAGAFSDGIELLQSWVEGVNLDDLYPEELEAVWNAVQAELDRRTDRKNLTKSSRRILSEQGKRR